MAEAEEKPVRINVQIPRPDHTALRVLCAAERVDFLRLVPAIIHQALAEPDLMSRAVSEAKQHLPEKRK